MLHAIASIFVGIGTFIGSLFGAHQQYGAVLPSATAVFETSLAGRISSTDTSMTLAANSVAGGTSLSGYQSFTIDEGLSTAEYVCGSVSGTSVTGMQRCIDHRRVRRPTAARSSPIASVRTSRSPISPCFKSCAIKPTETRRIRTPALPIASVQRRQSHNDDMRQKLYRYAGSCWCGRGQQ
jgi:hypothetical protein